ncbi:HDOD domain-containing protein [Oxalobacter vibrioformis]|uniref:HDOD domain-containing protein n=1 Tax=Oxalobacter vibrioformis TaxID=933080 RepID=A0A9E9P220_9BURK|nr:HDOD domain-containing protein [Oxalobacter vibrioformis]WAW09462.1 HDOD domain-containing protein [Oxalobacter vibrioformis]
MSVIEHHILNKLSATRLPTISQVLVKLLSLCQDDRASITELAKLIWQEPTMAQKILSVANSSAYIHTGPHVRLETGLIAMGTDMVRMLVINESIFQNFRGLSRNVRLDLRAFWHHSLTTAMIAYNAAKHMGYDHDDNAYLAGLMHDIGRLALMTVAPEKYASLFYRRDDEALCIQESHSLGLTHAMAGAWLVRYWKLDPAIAESIELHHEPFDRITDAPTLVRVVHLANQLAYCDEENPMIEALAARYGLELSTALEIMSNVREHVQKSADYLGIDISDIEPVPEEPASLPPLADQADMNQEILSLLNSAEFGRFFIRQTSQTHLQNAAILAACNILKLNHALLFWHSPAEDKYSCVATDTPSHKLLGISVPAHDSSVLRETATNRQPAFISSIDELTMAAEKNLALLIGDTHWVMIPVSDASRSLGVLFGSLSHEQLDTLKQQKWLIKNFVEQFILAWHRLQETKKHIQQEVMLVEEKYRHLSRASSREADSPVAIVRNYLHVLNQKLEKQGSQQNATTVLKEEITRLEQIIHDMVAPSGETAVTDLATLVPGVIQQFRDAHPAVIITEHRPDAGKTSLVRAPDNLLKQILVNLLRNAVIAIKDDGEIIITYEGHKERDGTLYYALKVGYRESGMPVQRTKGRHPLQNAALKKQQEEQDMGIVYSLLNQIHALIGSHSDINGTIFDILIPAYAPLTPKI